MTPILSKTLVTFETVTVDARGTIATRVLGQRPALVIGLNEAVSLTAMVIPAGEGILGSPPQEEGYQKSQGPLSLVRLNTFALGQFPVTQNQWQAVCQLPKVDRPLDPHCANFADGDRPVEQVTWHQAREFCQRLSHYARLCCRLPSEAEWEYACRGGTTTPFHFGPTITTELANYSGVDWEYQGQICNRGAYGQGPLGSDRRETTPVAHFAVANAWGLADLHGNVREWCADTWHPNYEQRPLSGEVWDDATPEAKRVVRGGSWNRGPQHCRSASRSGFVVDTALYDLGFRVAFTIPGETRQLNSLCD